MTKIPSMWRLPTSFFAVSLFTQLVSAQNQTIEYVGKITINTSQKFQTVDGFGVSQAFQRANQIQHLSTKNQTRVLDLLFSDTTGAGLTILRNGIGSSNSSIRDYMNTILPVSPGSPSSTPNYTWDGVDSGQVWLSQQVMNNYGVKIFYADAWSAPAFMKDNNEDTDGGLLCGVTGSSNSSCAGQDWRQAYADYLVQYLRYYEEAGVHITHVSWLNEPELTEPYASMVSDGKQAADFLKVFTPTLRKSGLDVKILCCDAAGWEYQRQMVTDIQKAGAEPLMDIIASHGYSSPPTTPFASKLPTWQTEWADLSDPWTTAWDAEESDGEGFTWAVKIQDSFVQSNCTAFIYWIGAEISPGNSMLIRLGNDTVEPSKKLWAMAQFSRFVKPGAVRVGSTSTNSTLHVSAFQNADGGLAIQVINTHENDTDVQLVVQGATSLGSGRSWLTDNTNDLTDQGGFQVSGGASNQTVQGRSMTSFIFEELI
ncbi:hypothetical protein G7Y89_g3287 [Cudoniella acicularis]|uniref:Uncharacterized protein n=1 Tax=Cudoniella acicularis TaxID=354080 RepID=A0A8H4RSY4_9HELO|nr:hypothetical protein G7Y89_g3287 [Cudoniella acicularis]